MTSRADLERQGADRAADRCEYCRMHQSLQGARFHLEHIVPTARGGTAELQNLAWACPSCNLRKADRVDAPEPESGSNVPLFHPRNHSWAKHFAWDDYHIVGLTSTGRATVAALEMNHPRRVRIRQAEQMFGLFPPEP
jgi:hypothetical protein